jgi:vacuolar-type H+-ATPase subunit I/STV1
MSDLTKADLRERLGNIDQLRDILFGPQLREYTNRLEQLERDLASVQQEFRNRNEELRQSVLAELHGAVENLEKRIRSLVAKDEEEKLDIRQQIETLHKRIATTAEELQDSIGAELDELAENADKRFKVIQMRDGEEKLEIRQQLDLLSKRITGNLEVLDENLEKQTSALHTSLQTTQTKFNEELSDLRTQVFEELERYCSMLSQVKVSRDDMAELLFELGLRLKGSEFVPELSEVAKLINEPLTIVEHLEQPPQISSAPLAGETEADEEEAPEEKTAIHRSQARRTSPRSGRLR